MDAKNKLLILMLFTSFMGLLYQTPLMQAVGGGAHRFVNGNNVDCLSCHGNYPNAEHQIGLSGHQSAAENRNYTTYLEVGGISYDPSGIIYTNIDSDLIGGNDIWVWSGYMWIYNTQAKLYNLDFNNDGNIDGSESCKLCHNRELMRVRVQEGPEHTFSKRSCNDARCHGNSNEDYRFFKTGYNTIPPASITNPAIMTGNFYINNTWTNPSDNDFDHTIFNYSNGSVFTYINNSINYLNLTVSPHYVQEISAQTVDMYGNFNETTIWFNATLPNNLPVLEPIGNRNVNAGNLLQFNVTATDADNDTLVYGTNAIYGTLDTATGNYSWQTGQNDTGEYVWYFNSTDDYGGIASETIVITVSTPTVYIPPIPANLSVTQGNFWINYTWEAGTGNLTDSYNLSLNGNWSNGTSLTYHNDTVGPHGWSNITVWAYNNSGGMNSVSMETQVMNNMPILAPVGNINVTAGSLLQINISAFDADNDTMIFGTNASSGLLNETTGEYSWLTNASDAGIYTWYFNSSDNYGGIASETINVTVTAQTFIPPVPVNLTVTQGNFWIEYAWEAGIGNITDRYNLTVNGTPYTTNSTLRNDTVGPHGWSNISIMAYNSSGTGSFSASSIDMNTQVSNNIPVQSPIGDKSITAGDVLSFTVSATDADSDPITYGTNASNGLFNETSGEYSWTTTGLDVGTYTLYFNSSDNYSGIASETINVTVTAQTFIPPVPVNLTGTQGNFWIEYTWEAGIGNITNRYNLTVNGTPYTTNSTLRNDTVGPHGWSNISIMAYNSSGTGSFSASSIDMNTQVSNNIPVQSPIGDRSITAGDVLSFTVSATDVDSDPITYGTNASNGLFNETSGEYSWTTTGLDVGTYTWYFNSSDNYGGIDSETINVTVTAQTFIPPVPANLTGTQGNFWVEYTWEAGIGNITDSYNLTVNGAPYNTSTLSRNDSVGPHGWSNISIRSYNSSGSGSLSASSIDMNTQVSNNIPVQSPIGDKSITAGDVLSFTISATDVDSDQVTYGTNASNGLFNDTTGEYSWTTTGSDVGTYTWYFNSSDNYGGVDTETITITVDSQPIPEYIPPAPTNLAFSRGNFWVEYTWEAGIGNITNSYNLTVNGAPYTTSTLSRNDTVGPHGWSNISIRSYNSSGTGSFSASSIDMNTQVSNNIPVQSPIGDKSITAGDVLSFTVSATDADSDPITYGTNASNGLFNDTTGEYSWSTTGSDVGTYTWYFNSSDNYGGVDTETLTITVDSQPIPEYIPPAPTNLAFSRGNFWVEYTWEAGIGNITNSYNLTVNGAPYTTSTLSRNDSVGPHGWSNISIRSYNSSGSGSLSASSIDMNTQVSNNIPVQSPIGDKSITAGDVLSFTVSATDADSDPITYGTNASNGLFNDTTGEYSWSTTGSDVGTYTWYFNSSDNYGGIDSETLTITVDSQPIPEYIPPAPTNLAFSRGNFWVEYTWEAGIGNITNSYNLTVNGAPYTTSTLSRNDSVGPHGWSNISIRSYNSSGTGSFSASSIDMNTQVSNNIPVQSPIGDKSITAGDVLSFTISATDVDSDQVTYGTNASNGLFNDTTGEYSWTTTGSDVGTYTWYFNSSDNYGGVDTETITITVDSQPIPEYIPPAPTNLAFTRGNFWVEYTWEAGIGNITNSYNLTVNGAPYTTSTLSRNDSVGPHGWSNISIRSYNSSGTGSFSASSIDMNTQVSNNIPVQSPIGDKSITAGDVLSFTISATDVDSDQVTYGTNASNGLFNDTTGEYSWTTTGSDVGTYTWYFNSSDNYGGVDTETITITVDSQPIPEYIPPAPTNLAFTRGNFWVEYTWEAGIGNITNSYNLTVNGAPYTTSTLSRNDSLGPHGWSNISIRSYNSSGSGSLSASSIDMNTQVSNNIPVQSPIGDKSITAGDVLSFTVSATDADSDLVTYGTNATKGSLNSGTGAYSWQTSEGDAGTYTWYFNTNDGYGGIDSETITITVNEIPTFIPPAPTGLSVTQGNFWIEYTWGPGTGNITDSYNLTVNSLDYTTSIASRNDNVGPHGWSNITIYAYNNSGSGKLSKTAVSQNTQVDNNVPVQDLIGSKTVNATELLTFTVHATDLDSDIITYSTDATRGSIDPSSGVFSWQTSIEDIGTYIWNFNSNDGFGGVASETVTITVQ